MKISVAAGKGGTGKTLLTLLLAAAAGEVTVIDCDVEEPNDNLFLHSDRKYQQAIYAPKPRIRAELCDNCGDCAAKCMFNAIAVAGGKPVVFDELCHSCGVCLAHCPQQAIYSEQAEQGKMFCGQSATLDEVTLVEGELRVGVPMAAPLIKRMKDLHIINGNYILDCPPGSSCTAVAALKGSDAALMVAEPNVFSRHDLSAALDVAEKISVPCVVVINKSDGAAGDALIERLCVEKGIEIIGRIPYDEALARQYAAGLLPDKYRERAAALWKELLVRFEAAV